MKFVAIVAAAATAQAAVGTTKKGAVCTGNGGCVADHFCGKMDFSKLTLVELKAVTGGATAVGTETDVAKARTAVAALASSKVTKCYAKATCGTTVTTPFKVAIDCKADTLYKSATALGATAIAALSVMATM